jgi:hypothetical protein
MAAYAHIDPIVRNYHLRLAAYIWNSGDAGGYLLDSRETRAKKINKPSEGVIFRTLLSRTDFTQNKGIVKQLSLDLTRGTDPNSPKF